MEQSSHKEASWEYLKWWTSTDTQVRFGREMEGILGAAASNDSETALAPTPSNTNAIIRNNLVDTNDNSADFITAAPTPRNTSSNPS